MSERRAHILTAYDSSPNARRHLLHAFLKFQRSGSNHSLKNNFDSVISDGSADFVERYCSINGVPLIESDFSFDSLKEQIRRIYSTNNRIALVSLGSNIDLLRNHKLLEACEYRVIRVVTSESYQDLVLRS